MSKQEAIKIFSQVFLIMTEPGSNISDMRQSVLELAEEEYGIDHLIIRSKPKNNEGCVNKHSCNAKHAGCDTCRNILQGKSKES